MKLQSASAILVTALFVAPAGAVVPGFAGNITGGGNATPVVVSTLSAAQTAVNNYSGSGGLVLHYNGTFDEAAILANICGQWSKPAQELSISGKNDITILGIDGSAANFGIRIKGSSSNIIVRNMKIGLVPGGNGTNVTRIRAGTRATGYSVPPLTFTKLLRSVTGPRAPSGTPRWGSWPVTAAGGGGRPR